MADGHRVALPEGQHALLFCDAAHLPPHARLVLNRTCIAHALHLEQYWGGWRGGSRDKSRVEREVEAVEAGGGGEKEGRGIILTEQQRPVIPILNCLAPKLLLFFACTLVSQEDDGSGLLIERRGGQEVERGRSVRTPRSCFGLPVTIPCFSMR